MKYNAKSFSKKVRSKVARRKSVRYHNDAALFPDDNLNVDRKRRASLKKINSAPKVSSASHLRLQDGKVRIRTKNQG